MALLANAEELEEHGKWPKLDPEAYMWRVDGPEMLLSILTQQQKGLIYFLLEISML